MRSRRLWMSGKLSWINSCNLRSSASRCCVKALAAMGPAASRSPQSREMVLHRIAAPRRCAYWSLFWRQRSTALTSSSR
eukprot:scaffold326198_cov67-Tisochrysis_lutea.AAC.2